ncbi:NUDIX hydrolase [Candidatus Nomurabacteria bacterium]|nr:NUDIX hydrolase [Candidatus Nomurabacteria bacterium]
MKVTSDLTKLYPEIDINSDGGPDAYREGLPIVERDPVAVIIKHPSENQYLLAEWKQAEWRGFLTGGIEKGDSLEKTVRKEIHEETGYKNVSEIIATNFVSHALFFHPVKNVNRLAHYRLVFARLADLERENVSEEEGRIADFVWVPHDEVLEILTRRDMKLLWNFYINNLKDF